MAFSQSPDIIDVAGAWSFVVNSRGKVMVDCSRERRPSSVHLDRGGEDGDGNGENWDGDDGWGLGRRRCGSIDRQRS